MKHYIFILQNPQRISYQKSILAIIGLNLIFFIYLAATTPSSYYRYISILVILFVLVSFAIKYFRNKHRKAYNAVLPDLIFIIFIYCFLQYWWPAIALLLITFFYLIAIRKLDIVITAENIDYPSFPRRKIQWKELDNLILKDGLLTIDFKNNKLEQTEIEYGQNEMSFNEEEFNDFCRNQLKE